MAAILELTTTEAAERYDGATEGDAEVLTRAETSECTCPDFCERDHDNE